MRKQVSVAFMICGLLFTVCLIVANIVSQKLIRIAGFDITAGLIIFPITYIINDLVAEVWGYRKMRLIIWYGFLLNFFVSIIFRITIWAPSSPHFHYQEAYSAILLHSERIVIASFIAFMFGSFLNAYVMSKMKIRQHGRHFPVRAIVSTMVGEGADSLVFFTIAFTGLLSNHHIFIMILMQTFLKTVYEILVLPLTNLLIKRIKKYEHIDTFDHGISYNPFKIKEI